MDWNTGIALYQQHLRAIGRRPDTILNRRNLLRRAACELPPLSRLNQGHVVEWLAEHNWGPEMRRNAMAALSGFFKFLISNRLLSVDPMFGLPPVRVPSGEPRPAPEGAVSGALSHAEPRIRCAAVLMSKMGLRRGEAARASVEDIRDGRLLVDGKGGKRRWVPLHPELLPELPDRGPLVPSKHDGTHMTPQHVGELISAALPPGVTAHQLRHRFATVAYRQGNKDVMALQKVLGHASPATTQRYVLSTLDEQRAVVLVT